MYLFYYRIFCCHWYTSTLHALLCICSYTERMERTLFFLFVQCKQMHSIWNRTKDYKPKRVGRKRGKKSESELNMSLVSLPTTSHSLHCNTPDVGYHNNKKKFLSKNSFCFFNQTISFTMCTVCTQYIKVCKCIIGRLNLANLFLHTKNLKLCVYCGKKWKSLNMHGPLRLKYNENRAIISCYIHSLIPTVTHGIIQLPYFSVNWNILITPTSLIGETFFLVKPHK